jgi:predicted ATP-binding protein involved in virulence
VKLQTLNLANYRGFEQLEITFQPDVNVIAGVNGVGKSSVLHALRALFSRALPQMTASKAQSIAFTDDDIPDGKPSLETSASFRVHDQVCDISTLRVRSDTVKRAEWAERLTQIPLERTEAQRAKDRKAVTALRREEQSLRSLLEEGDDTFTLLLEKVEVPSVRTGDLDAVQRKTQEILAGFQSLENQPLITYYSPLRHGFTRPRTLPDGEPLGVQKAFDGALEEREISFRDFMHWFKWLEHSDNNATKTRRERILKTLRQAVTDFVPEFKNLRLEETPRLRFIVEKSGVPLELGQLSDGERGLLALVFDLTRRLALANPTLDDPISQGQGIVLIDEIELHLHPSWQRKVMRRLMATFKNCQFIVTTHSPQVIGEVESRCVRFLERDLEEKIICWTPGQAFGKDSNYILELMGDRRRNKEIDEAINILSRLVDEEKFDEARQKILDIKDKIDGDDTDLSSAETLIAFLEGDE